MLAYLGCFRISEALTIKWKQIALKQTASGVEYISVKLVWYKTAKLSDGSKVYKLTDEPGVPHINPVTLYKALLMHFRTNMLQVHPEDYFFCAFTFDPTNGSVVVLLNKPQ